MLKQSTLVPLLVALAVPACAVDDAQDPSDGGQGGKADDPEDVDCAPDDELRIELVGRDANESADGDELTNSVTATCFNSGGFEDAICCEDAGLFDAYAAATSCPQRAEITRVEGDASLQRCRNSATGTFVDSACCADVCDPAATRNAAGRCIGTGGQFEDELCCFLTAAQTANACDGAKWETLTIDGEERSTCRNERTGRFAMNSCCAAECVAAVSEGDLTFANTPDACAEKVALVAPEKECPDGAFENSAGICHNPGDGQFVKAACCESRGSVAVVCGFGTEPSFGVFPGGETDDGVTIDPTHQLRDALGELGNDFVSIERETLTDDVRTQLHATVLHLGFLLPGQQDDELLFEVPDFDGFFRVSGQVGGVDIDWIRFFAGDTEVGVIFEAGTTQIIADIGDGDISGCSPDRLQRG